MILFTISCYKPLLSLGSHVMLVLHADAVLHIVEILGTVSCLIKFLLSIQLLIRSLICMMDVEYRSVLNYVTKGTLNTDNVQKKYPNFSPLILLSP